MVKVLLCVPLYLRPQTQRRAIASNKKLNKRLTKGEKSNAKRMATVASVYTINPFVRTPQQIVNPSEEDRKIKRPRPIGKLHLSFIPIRLNKQKLG